MPDAHKNFAVAAVAAAPSPAKTGTTLVLKAGHGARLPVAPFNASVGPIGEEATNENAEVVRVTAKTTDTLTIVRAQEETTARTIIVGDRLVAGPTAKTIADLEQLQFATVTSVTKSLGSVSGNVTLKLTEGSVFKAKITAAVVLLAPTGYAPESGRRYFEIEFEGKFATTFPSLKGWRYGNEPDLSGTSGITNVMFFTDDGTNFYGVGTEGLPSSVVKITGTAATGQVPVWNGTAWEPGTPATGGITTSAAEALVKERAIENGGNVITIGGTPAAGKVPYAASSVAASWTDLNTIIGKLVQTTITVGTTVNLETNHFYRCTGIKPKLVLPNESPVEESSRIVVENASEFALTVQGRFTPESSTVTSKEVKPGEVITYTSDAEAKFWRATSGYNAQSLNSAAVAGGYLAQTCDLPATKALLTAKTVHITKIMLPSAIDFTQIYVNIVKTGTLTAAYAAIYSIAGALLGFTSDEHTNWNEKTGVLGMKIGSSEAPIKSGEVWLAVLAVGSVMPELAAASFGGELKDINANTPVGSLRCGEARNSAGETAAYTTLPSPIDPTKNRGKANNFPFLWGAVA